MALGFSGSNGGISNYKKIEYSELSKFIAKYSSVNEISKKNFSEEKGLIKKLNQ